VNPRVNKKSVWFWKRDGKPQTLIIFRYGKQMKGANEMVNGKGGNSCWISCPGSRPGIYTGLQQIPEDGKGRYSGFKNLKILRLR
jgi:hypothetical protein